MVGAMATTLAILAELVEPEVVVERDLTDRDDLPVLGGAWQLGDADAAETLSLVELAQAGDGDLFAGADGIELGRQMGHGLEGTDAGHGGHFNKLATSSSDFVFSGPSRRRSSIRPGQTCGKTAPGRQAERATPDQRASATPAAVRRGCPWAGSRRSINSTPVPVRGG